MEIIWFPPPSLSQHFLHINSVLRPGADGGEAAAGAGGESGVGAEGGKAAVGAEGGEIGVDAESGENAADVDLGFALRISITILL